MLVDAIAVNPLDQASGAIAIKTPTQLCVQRRDERRVSRSEAETNTLL